VHPGDLVIVISYGLMESAEAAAYQPKVLFVDAANRIVHNGADPAFAPPGSGLDSGAETDLPAAETVDAARLDALLSTES